MKGYIYGHKQGACWVCKKVLPVPTWITCDTCGRNRKNLAYLNRFKNKSIDPNDPTTSVGKKSRTGSAVCEAIPAVRGDSSGEAERMALATFKRKIIARSRSGLGGK